jgi:hypothetical protein
MSAHYAFGNRQAPTSSAALAVGFLFGRYAKNECSLQKQIDDAWPSLLNKNSGVSYLKHLSKAMQKQRQRLESDLLRTNSLLAKLPGILFDFEQVMQSSLKEPEEVREWTYGRLLAAIADNQESGASSGVGGEGEGEGAASPPASPGR